MANWSDWRAPDRVRPPNLYPLFGITTFGADTECRSIHPDRSTEGGVGPMHQDDPACCMVCHRSGMDRHDGLKITGDDDARRGSFKPDTPDGLDQWSEPEQAAEPTRYAAPDRLMTRKERRAALKAGYIPPMDPDRLRRLVDAGGGKVAL